MKNLIFTLVTRGLLFISGILSSILTARLLSPADRGVFFYWSVVAGLFVQFGNFGFPVSNIYLYGKKQAQLLPLFVNSIYISIVAAGVIAGIIWFSFSFSAIDFVLMSIFVCLSIYYLFFQNLFVAQERFTIFNAIELGNRSLSIALLGGLVYLFPSPTMGYLAMVLALSSLTIIGTIMLVRGLPAVAGGWGSVLKFDRTLFRLGLKFSLKTYMTLILSYGFLRMNIFFIKEYFSADDLGVWSIAIQIFETLTIVPITFAFIVYPKLLSAKDPHRILMNQIKIVSLIMIIALGMVFITGEFLITVLYGSGYSESFQILLYGMAAIFAISLVSLFSQYVSAMGLPWQQLANWSAAIVVQLGIIVVIKQTYGLEGIMIALSVSSLLLLLLMWRLASRIQRRAISNSRQTEDLAIGLETMDRG